MSDDCPNDETLGRLVDGTIAPTLRERLRQHIARCGSCRAIVLEALRYDAGFESTEVALPLPRAGRYQLGRVLGMGGMGVVYAAEDPELGRTIAIKLMRRPENRGECAHDDDDSRVVRHRLRLVREGQSLARIVHPNVVSVYDVGQSDGQIFVAMELVEGGTLRDWSARGGHSFADVLAIFRAIGAGLAAVHEAGLVHRDFKPENVLIGDDGRPRVTDFGLARQDDDVELEPAQMPLRGGTLTQTGALLGTPMYMAPEQLLGKVVGPSADVFSFAVTIWEALFGKRPFTGETVEELESSIRSGDATTAKLPPPGTPTRRVRALLKKALAMDPASRPRLADLLRELDALGRPSRLRGPLGVGVAAACTMLLMLGATLGWQLRQRQRCDVGVFAAALSRAERALAVSVHIDRYVDELDAVQRDACAQTFVHHTMSEARYDAQRACLDRLDERLRLQLGAYDESPTAASVAEVFDHLPAPSSCVQASPEQKLDPALSQVLAQATTARAFGRTQRAHDLFKAALAQASFARSPTQLAEAQAGYGEALIDLGRVDEGQARLEAGLQSALYAGDYFLVADISRALLRRGSVLQLAPSRVYELQQRLHWASERGHLGEALRARGHVIVAAQHERDGRFLDAEIELRAAMSRLSDPAARAALDPILLRVTSKRDE